MLSAPAKGDEEKTARKNLVPAGAELNASKLFTHRNTVVSRYPPVEMSVPHYHKTAACKGSCFAWCFDENAFGGFVVVLWVVTQTHLDFFGCWFKAVVRAAITTPDQPWQRHRIGPSKRVGNLRDRIGVRHPLWDLQTNFAVSPA